MAKNTRPKNPDAVNLQEYLDRRNVAGNTSTTKGTSTGRVSVRGGAVSTNRK